MAIPEHFEWLVLHHAASSWVVLLMEAYLDTKRTNDIPYDIDIEQYYEHNKYHGDDFKVYNYRRSP